jgi:nitroreductase
MTEPTAHQDSRFPGRPYPVPPPIRADQAGYLIATAARAPSVHNTQPWLFRRNGSTVELYADTRRRLRIDPAGRELLISCGAALFGLRLGVRSLGYLPLVELLPDSRRPRLLARVSLGPPAPLTETEALLLEALPHRHTHRGRFAAGPLPDGLLAGLRRDALVEGATLAPVESADAYRRLSDLVKVAEREQDLDPLLRAEVRRWRRPADSAARDGVPAQAFASGAFPDWAVGRRGRLRQRDFDQGRGLGMLAAGGPPAAATAVLTTQGDGQADWLRAGQALHRLLAHAASRWVFASLYTQPTESVTVRSQIRAELGLPGVAQILLQLGRAHVTRATARRPPAELIEPPGRRRH